MLQKIIDFLKSLFSGFSASRKATPKAPPSSTTTASYPKSNLPVPNEEEPQDGSEITKDTAVVVLKETDPIINTNAPVEDSTVDAPDVNPPSASSGDSSPATSGGSTTTTTPPNNTSTSGTTSTGSASTTTGKPTDTGTTSKHKARYLWCLDNGHGSKTAGKRSPKLEDGTMLLEYKFNREIVERIVHQLKKNGVQYFIVVPEEDVDNLLEERVRRANAKTSVLPRIFVSVHSNAAPAPMGKWADPNISGIETWYYHNNARGRKVASIFQKHLVAATGWKNRFIKSRPTNQFYVLRNTNMTAVLTENGFYNNKAQCMELLKEETKDKIAAAHVDAIMEIEKHGI
jgi:N-acetylmuramoyl-L-alanine amidase